MITILTHFKCALRLRNLAIWVVLFSLGCGVNSGNPRTNPPPKTTSSIYLQSVPGGAMADFLLRVRGFQLIESQSLAKPTSVNPLDGITEVIFPEVKAINLMDYSKNGQIPLIENYVLDNLSRSQIRLLLDVTHAGTTTLTSGQKKIVHVLPVDLFMTASGQAIPDGGRQADQMVFKDESGLIKPGTDNKFAVLIDLGQMVTPPPSLNKQLTDFYLNEKKLTQDAINESMFIRPLQMDKKTVFAMEAMGFVRISTPTVDSGQVCLYAVAPSPSSLESSCNTAAYVLPIAANKAAGSIPKGDYVAVTFRSGEAKPVGDSTSFSVNLEQVSIELGRVGK